MPTKIQESTANFATSRHTSNYDGSVRELVTTCHTLNRIDYDDGPVYWPDHSSYWKSCEHVWTFPKNRCDLRGRVTNRQWWFRTVDVEWLLPGGDISALQRRLTALTARVKPAVAAEMLHEAEYVMQGRLTQTMLPITDLIQLVRKVDGLGSVDALLTSLLAPFRAKPKTWSDLVKKVAGADLARKFGVQTLMNTITDALKTGAVIDKHLRKLERIQNSQQDNFKVSVNDRIDDGSETVNFGGTLQGDTAVRAKVAYVGLATTSIHFRTSVRYDTSDALRTRLVWDALGLSNIFATAWDLMPLSFVVDWVVRVQEFAERLDSYYFHTVPLERMTELRDVWITSTVKAYAEYSAFKPVSLSYPYSVSLKNPDTSFKFEVGRFRRYPVDPGTTSAWLPSLDIQGGNLTLAQNLTGLELMIQRSF